MSEPAGDSPPTSPVFATAVTAVILAPMPTLEINATQPWLISQAGNVAEVERRLSVVEESEAVVSANSDESRDAVFQRVTRLRQSILQKTFIENLAGDAKPQQAKAERL